jgi:hypothetical protein
MHTKQNFQDNGKRFVPSAVRSLTQLLTFKHLRTLDLVLMQQYRMKKMSNQLTNEKIIS